MKSYSNKNVIPISINNLNSLIALKKLLLSEKIKISNLIRKMAALEKRILSDSKRIVIKVGSALIRSDHKNLINEIILNRIVKEIIKLNEAGKEILLVSSGALALGKKSLKVKRNNLKVSEKQAAASVGQVLLINAWKKAFLKYKKQCGQILLTHLDAEIK